MKRALIFGGGSRLGAILSSALSDQGYIVDVITSSDFQYYNVNTIKVVWKTLDLNSLTILLNQLKINNYDLIIFNQNSGKGPSRLDDFQVGDLGQFCPIDEWSHSVWSDCQLSYYAVFRLKNLIQHNTKIVWLLSGVANPFIPKNNLDRWVAYRSIKLTNYYIMKAFSENNPGIFFGIDPDHIDDIEDKVLHGNTVIERILAADSSYNGEVYNIVHNKFWAYDPNLWLYE
jgi:hypothetical protein